MKSLKDRLLAHGITWLGKETPKPEAKFEIDDVNGKKLSFPNIGSEAEIKEGVEVTADEGEHVLTIDGITYTVTVTSGKVMSVVEAPTVNNGAEDFMQAVAEAFAEQSRIFEAYRTEAKAEIEGLNAKISDLVTNLGHKKEEPEAPKTVVVNGKTFDKSKIKFN